MALFAATRSSTVRGLSLSQVAVVYFYAPRRKLKVCSREATDLFSYDS